MGWPDPTLLNFVSRRQPLKVEQTYILKSTTIYLFLFQGQHSRSATAHWQSRGFYYMEQFVTIHQGL